MTMHEDSKYSILNEEPVQRKPSTNDEEPIDITKSVAKEDKHLVQPAGVGAAVLGIIIGGGPILAALLGFSAAYAVRKKNDAGNAARALGELAISVQEKSSEIEEKHHFMGKTTKAVNEFCDDDREKSLPFKTRAFLVSTWLAVSNSIMNNQLLERGVEGTGVGLEFIGRTIAKVQGKETQQTEDVVFVPSNHDQDDFSGDFSSDPRYTELVKVSVN